MTVPFESSRLILSCWRVVAASPFWAMTDGVFWFPCAPGWTGDVEGSVPRLELLPLATAATPPSMTALPTARSIALKACSAPAVAILLVLAAAEPGLPVAEAAPAGLAAPAAFAGPAGIGSMPAAPVAEPSAAVTFATIALEVTPLAVARDASAVALAAALKW